MLKKTSCQLDPETITGLQKEYPSLSPSEIIRLCMQYVYETKPEIEVGQTRFIQKGNS